MFVIYLLFVHTFMVDLFAAYAYNLGYLLVRSFNSTGKSDGYTRML